MWVAERAGLMESRNEDQGTFCSLPIIPEPINRLI